MEAKSTWQKIGDAYGQLQKATTAGEKWLDRALLSWHASPHSLKFLIGAIIVGLIAFGVTRPACAGGYGDHTPTQPTGTSANAAAAAYANSQSTGGVGGSGTAYGGSSDNKTYVGGSTGLTSTAPCLGSVGILFNAISTTVAQEGCVLRLYAEKLCKDAECQQKFACLDPDLIPEAKAVLGCPQ